MLGERLNNPSLEEIFEQYRFRSKQTPSAITNALKLEVYAEMYDSMLMNILRVTGGQIQERDLRVLRGAVVPAFRAAIEGKKDDLTQLPNREMLAKITQRYMELADKIGGVVTFVYLDIDNFKLINDKFGHSEGDKFIATFGDKILPKVKRSYDIVGVTKKEQKHILPGKPARGDEFGIVFYGSQEISPTELCRRISVELMSHRQYLKGFDEIGVSMGIATYKRGSNFKNAEKLFDNADIAMYNAKELDPAGTKVKYVEFQDGMVRPRVLKG